MKTPKWAETLVEEICEAEGLEVPKINWLNYKEISAEKFVERFGGDLFEHMAWKLAPDYFNGTSFGQCWTFERVIDIGAGPNRQDQKLVLLHEMAHYKLNQQGYQQIAHSSEFWDELFRLLLVHRVPIMYGLARESKTKHRRSVTAWAKRQGLIQ